MLLQGVLPRHVQTPRGAADGEAALQRVDLGHLLLPQGEAEGGVRLQRK